MSREKSLKIVSSHYKSLFDDNQKSAKIVLFDLLSFCKMNCSTLSKDAEGRIDPVATAANEGRREVYLHIMERINIDLAELQKLIEAQEEEQKKWA